MKKTCIAVAVAVVMTLPTLLFAQVCAHPIQIADGLPTMQKIAAIKTALANYKDFTNADEEYEVCFSRLATSYDPMKELEIITPYPPGFTGQFVLNVNDAKATRVIGLRIRNKQTLNALVAVTNLGAGRVILQDFSVTNALNGISFAGTGPAEINASAVSGDAAKSGTCIDVKAPDTVISGVTVSGCDRGIKVWADGVKIQDKSVIKENKVGVEFVEGIKGSVVTEALVFLNNDYVDTNPHWSDGIRLQNADPAVFRLADSKVLRPAYYDVEGADVIPVDDDPAPYVFKGQNANILVDDLKDYFNSSTNTIEVRFYNSQDGECGFESKGQSCAYAANGLPLTVTLSAANFDEGKPVTVAIPDEFANKALAVLYEDSEMGTLGFSRPFKVSPGGFVAFVATPYDIPTTSGESADDAGGDDTNTAGDSMGGNTMSEGGGEGLVEAAGPGAKCSLTPHARSEGFSVVVDLLWLLLILGTIGGSRLLPLQARLSHRLHRRK